MNYKDKCKILFNLIDNNKFINNDDINIVLDKGINKLYIITYKSGLSFSALKYNKPLDYHFGINEFNYSIYDIIKLVKKETLKSYRKDRINKLYGK